MVSAGSRASSEPDATGNVLDVRYPSREHTLDPGVLPNHQLGRAARTVGALRRMVLRMEHRRDHKDEQNGERAHETSRKRDGGATKEHILWAGSMLMCLHEGSADFPAVPKRSRVAVGAELYLNG